MFIDVEPKANFPKIERNILTFWNRNRIFEKLLNFNRKKKRWSFLDGPITANNPMGVHHARGRTYKDFFRRFKSMRGYSDRYQNGFDVQGLWVEVEVEKELGLKSKRDIEVLGIDEFVKRCKQRALRYAAIQVEQSIRLGYWMEWDDPEKLRFLAEMLDNPNQTLTFNGPKGSITGTVEKIVGKLGSPEIGGSYFTFSDENNYMIWAFLKECHEKGWLYKGIDVMPWCPRCSTGISQHEILTDGYKELTHQAITVKFPLSGRPKSFLLVWTTTPWTLTSNVAVAVNPELTYVKIEFNNEFLYLAKETLLNLMQKKGKYHIVEELKGKAMESWFYDGPFDEFPAAKKMNVVKCHKIIPWKEVSEQEGTGLVHIAPGCGKEDLELGKMFGLPIISPINDLGIFTAGFGFLTGVHAYDSVQNVISYLKKKRLLFDVEDYVHRYPVCWRCGSELLFRLVDEWFINMGKKFDLPIEEVPLEEREKNLRYLIIESAKQARWIPPFGLLKEIDWLLNMDDWMISKKRYWGLAIPIWVCSKCNNYEVIGSKKELEMRAVEGWEVFEGHSPHRPWIDAIKIKCAKCGALSSRVPDVGNPWLDAGIIPFSTLNYRKDPEYWQDWFPADLISESLPGQFRNWFYAQLAMSTVLVRESPFKVCFGHGNVLAEDGRQMHKSWGNAIWFDDAVESMGADVMRWLYLSNPVASDMIFGYTKADEVKKRFMIPLWNIYNFFVKYANIDDWQPENNESMKLDSVLDCWILSRLNLLVKEVTSYLDDYSPTEASKSIELFVDELSKWYVRRSRRRFWKSEKDEDKKSAYYTLYTCLTTLTKLLSPFIPFLTEHMYQNLVRRVNPETEESIHHTEWPVAVDSMIDLELLEDMKFVIRICGLGRSARNKAGIRLRQPLQAAIIIAEDNILDRVNRFSNLIEDELNLKKLITTTQKDKIIDYEIQPRPDIIGKKYGALYPKLRNTLALRDQNDAVKELEQNQKIIVEIDGEEIALFPDEVIIRTKPKTGFVVVEEPDLIVAVNTDVSEKLKKEGLARDIVRRIQNQRKDAGFDITDRIETHYIAGPKLVEVFNSCYDYISSETLSTSLNRIEPTAGAMPADAHQESYEIDGEQFKIGLRKANTAE